MKYAIAIIAVLLFGSEAMAQYGLGQPVIVQRATRVESAYGLTVDRPIRRVVIQQQTGTMVPKISQPVSAIPVQATVIQPQQPRPLRRVMRLIPRQVKVCNRGVCSYQTVMDTVWVWE